MKKLTLYFIIAFLASSCAKKEREVLVEGRLMRNCTTPLSNAKAYIMWHNRAFTLPGAGGSGGYRTWAEVITDNNGYFRVSKLSYEGRTLEIRVDKNEYSNRGVERTVLKEIIHNNKTHINLGNIYTHYIEKNFIIKLNVINPYTENDTLIIRDFWNPQPYLFKKIPGPFYNTTLDSVKNFHFDPLPFSWSEINEGKTLNYNVYIRINSNNEELLRKITWFDLAPICSGGFTEVTLVID